jgi:Putative transposase
MKNNPSVILGRDRPKQVIEYLGRYTHKIAISTHRIKNVSNGKVTFSYKDYADGAKQKLMTLDAEEFLRRFCLHILPPGFRKIRHYGILSSRAKPKLRIQQMKMGIIPINTPKQEQKDWKEITKTKLKTAQNDLNELRLTRKISLPASAKINKGFKSP